MSLRFAQMYTLPNTSEYLRTLTWFPTFTKSIAKNSRVLAMPSIWYLQNHPLKKYISYGFQSFVHTFCCYLWTTTKSPKQISTENPFNPRKNIHPPPPKKKKKNFPPKTPGRPFALCPPFCLLSNIASNSSKASDHCEERSMTLIMEP